MCQFSGEHAEFLDDAKIIIIITTVKEALTCTYVTSLVNVVLLPHFSPVDHLSHTRHTAVTIAICSTLNDDINESKSL